MRYLWRIILIIPISILINVFVIMQVIFNINLDKNNHVQYCLDFVEEKCEINSL